MSSEADARAAVRRMASTPVRVRNEDDATISRTTLANRSEHSMFLFRAYRPPPFGSVDASPRSVQPVEIPPKDAVEWPPVVFYLVICSGLVGIFSIGFVFCLLAWRLLMVHPRG